MNYRDIIGIGFGPANIALAAAIEEERPHLSPIFLEMRSNFIWQENMLFENALDIHSNIQNIPHRDLATPRSPRSRYTFLNYLHENDRLFSHLNMDLMMPMRPEFADYINWCACELSHHAQTNTKVASLSYDEHTDLLEVRSAKGEIWYTKNVVLGHGREPRIPKQFSEHISDNVFHFTQYKTKIEKLVKNGAKKIAVIGSSQTAAELALHITKEYSDVEAHIIMRRFAFPLKDTSPFMSEIYFPSFTKFYSNASQKMKDRIDKDVYRTNYGAADMDVINEIYRQVYHESLYGTNRTFLHRLSDIQHVTSSNDKVTLTITNHLEGIDSVLEFDGVVLATGFKNYGSNNGEIQVPELLKGVKEILTLKQDAIDINQNYEVATHNETQCKIFMNGLSENVHGMGDAGSLSLTSLRAMTILDQLSSSETKFSKENLTPMDKEPYEC